MNEKDRINKALDSIRPTEEQKEAMWARIESAAKAETGKASAGEGAAARSINDGNTFKKVAASVRTADVAAAEETAGNARRFGKKSNAFAKRLIALAAAVVLVIGGISWSSTKTEQLPSLNGYVYAAESRTTDMTADEVLVFTGDPAANNQFYVYAPKIYYLDSTRAVFGNGTGLIVYNIAESRTEGMIDMQAICSGYYNCDSIMTHVLVDGNELTVYNTENPDKPWGYYHVFDLSDESGDGFFRPVSSGNEEDVIEGYIEQGKAFEAEHFVDAWDHMPYLQSKEMDDAVGYGYGTYSELAYVCKSETGELTNNVIVCRDMEKSGYELCSVGDGEDAEPVFTALDLGITDEVRQNVSEINKLPAYTYTGSDAAVGVICNYLAGEYTDEFYGGSGVSIPAPIIYAQEEKDGELLVFGNFWTDQYCKNGNTLISVSGGEMPACFHLVKSGDSYEIASVDIAEDGEMYDGSIKKMTEDFPGLYNKMIASDGEDENIRRDAIREYVVSNGLGIDYYKYYGWDPLELD